MSEKQTPTTVSEWKTGIQAWDIFTERYPELGMRKGKWAFHNFLRVHRRALEFSDAIRKARKRFWVAHLDRFCDVAFDCATGCSALAEKSANSFSHAEIEGPAHASK